jgi:3',5'-cyclic AMP phosphodiesterase CpdA
MTRRSFLHRAAAAPLAHIAGTLLALAGCGQTGPASAPSARILHVTDLHYLAPTLTDHGACFTKTITQADGKVMRYSEELAEAFVADVLAAAPDCVVFSGDLTFNGARESHEQLAAKLARIRQAGIPVYVLPGNHDLQNGWAVRFVGSSYEKVDSITPEEFAALYADCGYTDALARDEATLSYVAEPVAGLRLLLVDGNLPGQEGVLSAAAVAFAKAQLRAAQRAGARVIAVSHQPLLAHNALFADAFSMRGAEDLLALYQEYGVGCNLCGHIHLQHIAQSDGGLTEIAGSALSVAPDQYGTLTVRDEAGSYTTTAAQVSAWAAAQGRTEADLLDFDAYTADFFRQTCLWQADNALESQVEAGTLTAAQAEQLSQFYAQVNAAYFSGRLDRLQTLWDETLYEQWQQTGAFPGLYLQSIRDEARVDHTQWSGEV